MSEPDKPQPEKNDKIDLNAAGEKVRGLAKKSLSFFKKAKAAATGDEKAQEELADAAAGAWVKTADVLNKANKAAGDLIDQADKKITEKLVKKDKPPTP